MKRTLMAAVALALALAVAGCSSAPKAQTEGQKQTEQVFEQQSKAIPYPADSLRSGGSERKNLRERLLRQNDPNRIGYVYFVSFGKFLGYWTIKGKVSSTQSQMTTSTTFTKGCASCDWVPVTAAGDDASYGQNEPGVFFFTTEGAMIQLPENEYVYSDQPIAIGNLPELNGQGTVKAAE